MQWRDELRPVDERLEPALSASDTFRPDLVVVDVLRHVAGRRVTALADDGRDIVIVKVFHSPRARGNHRRLTALAAADLVDIVPTSLGCDATGHVGAVGHRPGVELHSVHDDQWVAACRRAGIALRRLHGSGADLDRAWTVDDEMTQLRAMTPPSVASHVDQALNADDLAELASDPLVPAHRDCHPKQLIVDGHRVAWIDLDDCAMAPAALDVGNMLAHLRREALVGRRTGHLVDAARSAFLDGYGEVAPARCHQWERLSLLRLAGLAETRHHAPAERDALLDALGALPA